VVPDFPFDHPAVIVIVIFDPLMVFDLLKVDPFLGVLVEYLAEEIDDG
jgi:hypothetical protein